MGKYESLEGQGCIQTMKETKQQHASNMSAKWHPSKHDLLKNSLL